MPSNPPTPSIFLPPSQTRLVTVTAHVDHGKTTLSDHLIEHNGLISERMAGTLRYLDSDPEEQRRGITIRASAIGLKHQVTPHKVSHDSDSGHDRMRIIHLVDSPGHADFSREVSTSLLACDGTLLVLDVVEGMGARTHQLLREAREHQLVPILVINKMDRLCCELSLTPLEAYVRVRELLETVNAAAAAMLNSAQHAEQNAAGGDSSNTAGTVSVTEEEEKLWTFDPAVGNVIFASAFHGWAFAVPSLARSLFRSKTIHIKPGLLKQYLFGDYKLRGADRIIKWKQNQEDNTLFAEFALKPLWDVYQSLMVAAAAQGQSSNWISDPATMDPVLRALQIGSTGANSPTSMEELATMLRQTGAQTEEAVTRVILKRFRPLATAVLDQVSEYLPSPADAVSTIRSRALALKLPETGDISPELNVIRQSVATCDDSVGAPNVAHVCKFMAADRANVRDAALESSDGSSSSIILGLARVLSGQLVTGSEYFLLGPKHRLDGPTPEKRAIRCYLLMGSSFILVDQVPAGHLCAIANLEDIQLKTVTLCDSPSGMPLQGFDNRLRPLVKVNVEPENAADGDVLEQGLAKLGLADASVEITLSDKGERLLACLGELHLEQSLLDLKTVYCSHEIGLRVSDPIVDFGETTDWFDGELDFPSFFDSKMTPLRQTLIPPYNEEVDIECAKHGRMRSILPGRSAAVSIRLVPLLAIVFQSVKEKQVMEGSEEELIKIGKAIGMSSSGQEITPESVLATLVECACSMTSGCCLLADTPAVRSGESVMGVLSTNGEVYVPNLGGNDEGNESCEARGIYLDLRSQMKAAGSGTNNGQERDRTKVDSAAHRIWNEDLKGSLSASFQNALRSGPFCEEPIRNVLVVVEGVEIAVQQKDDGTWRTAKPISAGMIVAALGTGVRCALLSRPARLMEKHLKLTLHSSLSALGALYPVLHKRRGKVLEESMVDGTDLLLISASIPQAEAFGLAPEVFGKTSGEVTAPEMNFSHWERLDIDPFWIPTTEEEREDYGELLTAGDASTGLDNPALKYIRQVRRRKGLRIDQARTVVAAEKQRTLKR